MVRSSMQLYRVRGSSYNFEITIIVKVFVDFCNRGFSKETKNSISCK